MRDWKNFEQLLLGFEYELDDIAKLGVLVVEKFFIILRLGGGMSDAAPRELITRTHTFPWPFPSPSGDISRPDMEPGARRNLHRWHQLDNNAPLGS